MEPLLFTSSLLIGKELFTQTISKTTTNIYSNVNEVLADEDFEFKKILEKMDIKIKLDIIHKFIEQLECEHKLILKNNNTIHTSLNYVVDIIKDIETEIKHINDEIKIHKLKWFHRFRAANYKTMINNLIIHLKLLDERFELFIKLLKIYI